MSKHRFDVNELIAVPLSYLMSSSQNALEAFELARLAHAANLEKEIEAITRERDKEKLSAEVARWLRENREEILRNAGEWLQRTNPEPKELSA